MKTICYLADASNSHTIKWAKYFKNKGYNVHVISLNEGKIEGINVHNFNFNVKELKNENVFKKVKYITSIKEIKKLIKEIKPDILHAHYASSYGLIGSLLNYRPYVLSVWGTDIYDFPKSGIIQKSIIKYNLHKADYIFSTSKDMARETKLYTNKKIYITPFGVDMDVFKKIEEVRINKDKNSITIGTIKTLEKKYGIEYLIRAFKLILDKYEGSLDINLKVGGSGSQLDTLKELVEELKIQDKVEFLGRVREQDVPYIFNKFDIAVFPSLRESFGVAAVEAQACEIPVIVTNVGGHKEAIAPSKTGIVIESQDSNCLYEELVKLIDNENIRKEMSSKCRDFIKDNYELNSNFEYINSIYLDILDDK